MEKSQYTEICNCFTDFLNRENLRKTEERYAILEQICSYDGHFDRQQLYEDMLKDRLHVSRATVYNTLDVLEQAQLVVRHQILSQSVQYELKVLADTHLHLICQRCGMVREVPLKPLLPAFASFRTARFTPENYCLYIYGLCHKCKRKRSAGK
ncbi:MAG: Fur family transcriptional regulator [Parabacteroides sp.]